MKNISLISYLPVRGHLFSSIYTNIFLYLTTLHVRRPIMEPSLSHLGDFVQFVSSVWLVLATTRIRLAPQSPSWKIPATKACGAEGWWTIRAFHERGVLANQSHLPRHFSFYGYFPRFLGKTMSYVEEKQQHDYIQDEWNPRIHWTAIKSRSSRIGNVRKRLARRGLQWTSNRAFHEISHSRSSKWAAIVNNIHAKRLSRWSWLALLSLRTYWHFSSPHFCVTLSKVSSTCQSPRCRPTDSEVGCNMTSSLFPELCCK